jgi:nitrous-oxide reductase
MNKSVKIIFLVSLVAIIVSCGKKQGQAVLASNAAQKVYVAPGEKDEVYAFMSGGFNGQIGVYGIPSARLFKIIPVFSLFQENSYGSDEETKDMLLTSKGYVTWDDSHHPELSLNKRKS